MHRHGIVAILNAVDGLKVVANVADAAKLSEVVADTQPDVIVAELSIIRNEPSLAASIRARYTNVQFVAIGAVTLTDEIGSILAAGVRGYLSDFADGSELVGAIRLVASGAIVVGEPCTVVIHDRATRTGEADVCLLRLAVHLTGRERDVLSLLVRGMENAEIAEHLHLGPQTVKTHVSELLRKLGYRNRVELAVAALRAAMVVDPQMGEGNPQMGPP
jgi:DNA-binding NarL/FixJ family response regulator